jgi:hypothetical protein
MDNSLFSLMDNLVEIFQPSDHCKSIYCSSPYCKVDDNEVHTFFTLPCVAIIEVKACDILIEAR